MEIRDLDKAGWQSSGSDWVKVQAAKIRVADPEGPCLSFIDLIKSISVVGTPHESMYSPLLQFHDGETIYTLYSLTGFPVPLTMHSYCESEQRFRLSVASFSKGAPPLVLTEEPVVALPDSDYREHIHVKERLSEEQGVDYVLYGNSRQCSDRGGIMYDSVTNEVSDLALRGLAEVFPADMERGLWYLGKYEVNTQENDFRYVFVRHMGELELIARYIPRSGDIVFQFVSGGSRGSFCPTVKEAFSSYGKEAMEKIGFHKERVDALEKSLQSSPFEGPRS